VKNIHFISINGVVLLWAWLLLHGQAIGMHKVVEPFPVYKNYLDSIDEVYKHPCHESDCGIFVRNRNTMGLIGTGTGTLVAHPDTKQKFILTAHHVIDDAFLGCNSETFAIDINRHNPCVINVYFDVVDHSFPVIKVISLRKYRALKKEQGITEDETFSFINRDPDAAMLILSNYPNAITPAKFSNRCVNERSGDYTKRTTTKVTITGYGLTVHPLSTHNSIIYVRQKNSPRSFIQTEIMDFKVWFISDDEKNTIERYEPGNFFSIFEGTNDSDKKYRFHLINGFSGASVRDDQGGIMALVSSFINVDFYKYFSEHGFGWVIKESQMPKLIKELESKELERTKRNSELDFNRFEKGAISFFLNIFHFEGMICYLVEKYS
jgi:hypothetical protein